MCPKFTALKVSEFLENLLTFCQTQRTKDVSHYQHYSRLLKIFAFMADLSTLHSEYIKLKVASNLRLQIDSKNGLGFELDSKDRIEEAYYFLSSKGRDFLVKMA